MVLQTPAGNVLWDLIAFLDDATVQWVRMRLSASEMRSLSVEDRIARRAPSHCHIPSTLLHDIRGMVEDIQMPSLHLRG